MNEHETTPERAKAPSSEGEQIPAAHRPAGADQQQGSSGSSDETTRPIPAEPVTQPVPSAASAVTQPVPTSAAPTSTGAPANTGAPAGGTQPGGTGAHQTPVLGQPTSAAPGYRPGYTQYPPSPWAPGGAHHAGQAHAAQAHAAAAHQAAHQAGHHTQTSQWAQPAAHAAAGHYTTPSPYPGYHTTQQGHPGQPGQVPAWAQPAATPATTHGDRRFGRMAATAAAAVVLALGAGAVGAWTALAIDEDPSVTATDTGNGTSTGNGEPAPVIDRSSLASIAASVQDSVVSITTDNGEGSGVVLTADGYILTNNHVVASASNETVTVVFANGTKLTAKIVGTDARTDLGVVKADGVSNLTAAKFGDSAAMKVGDTVLALGSPLGLQGSVTAGIISAKDRTIQVAGEEEQQNPFGQQQQTGSAQSISGLLQTDAPINPGNSGGALVNTNGEVIGINTAIATSGQGSGSIGLGFAIPSNKAKEVAEALKTGQKVSHPFLGVSVTEAEGGGALVGSVSANSPAQKAGLQRGDVITQINGKAVNGSDDVIAAVQAGKVGEQVTVQYTRNGAQKTATATLAEAS